MFNGRKVHRVYLYIISSVRQVVTASLDLEDSVLSDALADALSDENEREREKDLLGLARGR